MQSAAWCYLHCKIASLNVSPPVVRFSPCRNTLRCSSAWTPPRCLRRSSATPGPFPSSGTAPDLPCKYIVWGGKYAPWPSQRHLSRSLVVDWDAGRGRACVSPQDQGRLRCSQPDLSARHVSATAASLAGGERGGRGGRGVPLTLPPLPPPPASSPPPFTHTGNQWGFCPVVKEKKKRKTLKCRQ